MKVVIKWEEKLRVIIVMALLVGIGVTEKNVGQRGKSMCKRKNSKNVRWGIVEEYVYNVKMKDEVRQLRNLRTGRFV